jgi:branched-chain amino acid transport system ATP-binding protein
VSHVGVAALTLDCVGKSFGGIHAVRDVSLQVLPKQIFGLIGPNGAGKTTLFNLITGIYPLDRGSIQLAGQGLSGLNPAQIAGMGVARTFQNIRLFKSLTVEQNVTVAGYHARSTGTLAAIFRALSAQREMERVQQRAHELLDLMNLLSQRDELAGSLSYGAQRRLEIARALMLEPKIILLDEPAAGMNSQESLELNRQIRFLRDQLELTVILVEHNMAVVMGVCDAVHVVDHGETIAHGTPQEVREHPRVLSAYLGQSLRPRALDPRTAPDADVGGVPLETTGSQ